MNGLLPLLGSNFLILKLSSGSSTKEWCWLTVKFDGDGVTLLTREPDGIPVKVSNTSNSIFLGKAFVLSKSIADIDSLIEYKPELVDLSLWATPCASFIKKGVKSTLNDPLEYSIISNPNKTDLAKASSTALFSRGFSEFEIYLRFGWISKILLPFFVK